MVYTVLYFTVLLIYFTGSYEEARCKANQATITSNLESEDEDSIRRKIRPPARYSRALDSGKYNIYFILLIQHYDFA